MTAKTKTRRKTKTAADRAYTVLMYGLSEENRLCPLPKEELRKRWNEIWQDCYGKEVRR